jgi:hypothetical protein
VLQGLLIVGNSVLDVVNTVSVILVVSILQILYGTRCSTHSLDEAVLHLRLLKFLYLPFLDGGETDKQREDDIEQNVDNPNPIVTLVVNPPERL